MKIAREIVLINAGDYQEHAACVAALDEVRDAIADVSWPPGAQTFTIHPQSPSVWEEVR